MDLKELLGEDLYNQVTEKAGEQKIAIVSNGNWIPKEKFDDKNNEVKGLKAEIKNRDEQITNLQKAVKGNEELETKLKDLEKANGDWEAKYRQTQIDTAIKLAAKDAKDPADVLAFINKQGLEMSEDGTVKGLDDALKGLRESKPYLFAEEPAPGLRGRTPHTPPGTPPSITKDQFNKMTYQERVNLYTENPDLYQKLNQ